MSAWKAARSPPLFEVWPDCWKTVLLFMRAVRRRCWRYGFAGPVAFDFALVRKEARHLGIRLSRRRQADLEIMEEEALRQIRSAAPSRR